MGWLIALAVIVLVAICPVGVCAKYNENGPRVKLQVGFLKFLVIPSSKKEKKEKKEKNPEKTTEKTVTGKKTAKPAKEEPKGGSFTDFMPLVQVALDFLGEFRRKLRVKKMVLVLVMAGSDPCDLAVNYGRANAALGNLWPQLEKLFVIKKRDVRIECDFTADKTLVWAQLDLNITVGRILSLLVRYGYRALREYLKIKKKREGGAVK